MSNRELSPPQERVAAAFGAEGEAGAVAADEGEVVAEQLELVPDRADQGVVVAIREIGAAGRAVEPRPAELLRRLRAGHEVAFP
jgi:hypothetical protein